MPLHPFFVICICFVAVLWFVCIYIYTFFFFTFKVSLVARDVIELLIFLLLFPQVFWLHLLISSFETGSLNRPGWPRTHFVIQANLELLVLLSYMYLKRVGRGFSTCSACTRPAFDPQYYNSDTDINMWGWGDGSVGEVLAAQA